jgi:membrane protease YdiL (CAAX protease family)
VAQSDWRKEMGLEEDKPSTSQSGATVKGKQFVNQGYWKDLRKWVYALGLAIPLAIIYELLCLIVNRSPIAGVRSAVEVGILSLLSFLGVPAWLPLSIIFILIFLFLLWWQRRRGLKFNWKYLLFGWGESLVWGLLLGLALIILTSFLLKGAVGNTITPTFGQNLAVSFGAGLYEELAFRVALIPFTAWLLLFISRKMGKGKLRRWVAIFIAVIFSSLVFSLFHHLGNMAEPFTLPAFLFRFLAGLCFAAVFALRGYGVAAWAHAFYDVLVITGVFNALLG